MKFIEDVHKEKSLIHKAIERHGHCVEHHLEHYCCCHHEKNKLRFVDLGKKRGVLLSENGSGVWNLFPNGVLAPAQERWRALNKVLKFLLLKKKAKKVVVEVDERFRKEMLHNLAASRQLKALSPNYILYWPIFHMELLDEKMKGKKWKKLRNIRNRFFKQHRIRIVDSTKVSKEKLLAIVKQWMRRRKQTDEVTKEYYYNVISSNFKGFDMAKTIYVDGKPCTITAGWEVKNGEKHYYSAVGLFNYDYPGLGEFTNLMDLLMLKKKGYRIVDFGGSGASLLNFKSKFKPHQIYKTYSFSVVRK